MQFPSKSKKAILYALSLVAIVISVYLQTSVSVYSDYDVLLRKYDQSKLTPDQIIVQTQLADLSREKAAGASGIGLIYILDHNTCANYVLDINQYSSLFKKLRGTEFIEEILLLSNNESISERIGVNLDTKIPWQVVKRKPELYLTSGQYQYISPRLLIFDYQLNKAVTEIELKSGRPQEAGVAKYLVEKAMSSTM